jgi:hypothetical protein
MQPNYLRRFPLVEMAIDSVAYLLAQGIQRLRFGKDGLAQSASGKTAFRRFLDQENDFVHAYRLKARLDFPRFDVNPQGRCARSGTDPPGGRIQSDKDAARKGELLGGSESIPSPARLPRKSHHLRRLIVGP